MEPRKQTMTLNEYGTEVWSYEGLGPEHDRLERVEGEYRIGQMGSIFTSRNHKQDIHIQVVHDKMWGALIDGKYHDTVCVIACEDGRIIRNYGHHLIPQHILAELVGWGFTYPKEMTNE